MTLYFFALKPRLALTLTLKQLQKRRALKEPVLNARRLMLEKRLINLEREIDEIMMEKLKECVSTPRPR